MEQAENFKKYSDVSSSETIVQVHSKVHNIKKDESYRMVAEGSPCYTTDKK